MATVSIIIPTTCEISRWQALLRAINSVKQHEGVEVKPIIVVNGNRFDAECYEKLKEMPGLDVHYRKEGSAPLAQYAGRLAVNTEFFAFLDDDDEYLPNTLPMRIQPLLQDPTLDFTVSNGYRRIDKKDHLVIQSPEKIGEHPLLALSKENWMASCAGLFRTDTVTPEFFSDPAPYMEWTYLAYRLGTKKRMHFVDIPAYVIHDSKGSLSKSNVYRTAELEVLQRILELPLPPEVARAVQKKIGDAHHNNVGFHLERGEMNLAWAHHVKSLTCPGGYSYLFYSRKVLKAHALHALNYNK